MIQKTIRRFGLLPTVAASSMMLRATIVALFAMLFIAATSPDSAARTHKTRRQGKHGRLAQNARHRMTRHSYRGKRFARLSHHHSIPQRALTSQEKTEIVQKIRELAENPSRMIGNPDANPSDGITNPGGNSSSGDDSV